TLQIPGCWFSLPVLLTKICAILFSTLVRGGGNSKSAPACPRHPLTRGNFPEDFPMGPGQGSGRLALDRSARPFRGSCFPASSMTPPYSRSVRQRATHLPFAVSPAAPEVAAKVR